MSAAISSLGEVLRALLAENEAMRRQVDGVVRLLRADGAPQRKSAGNGRRGRPFRFNAGQVAGLRKQVERGTAVPGLAKTHKFTAATIYAALKRAGWRRRK